MSRRDELVAEVMDLLERYQQAIETGTRDEIQTMVHLPVAYIAEDSVQMRERYPFDPVKLREATGFHHGASTYNVLHIDETKAHVVIELGRYIVGESGVYVCRVIDRKVSRGETFLITDGGLHHHLAASGNFGQVIRRNYPLAVGNRMKGKPLETVNVVGPLCTPLDLLGAKMELPRAKVGDLIVVFQSGAYGPTASPINFLSHPGPKEVLV